MKEEDYEEVPGEKNEAEDKEEEFSLMAYQLVDALCELYSFDGSNECLELKTTMDIMEEMGQIADVSKHEIAGLLEQRGFRLKYTEAGVYWMMYTREFKV